MHYVNNTELFSHEETRRQFDGGYSGTAKDSKDYVYVGAVLEREINEWLTLGAELFGNSPTTRARISRPSTITSRHPRVVGSGEATTSLSDRNISFYKAGAQPTPRS